jgi:hypothetical protein
MHAVSLDRWIFNDLASTSPTERIATHEAIQQCDRAFRRPNGRSHACLVKQATGIVGTKNVGQSRIRAGKAIAVFSEAGLALFDEPAWRIGNKYFFSQVIFVALVPHY